MNSSVDNLVTAIILQVVRFRGTSKTWIGYDEVSSVLEVLEPRSRVLQPQLLKLAAKVKWTGREITLAMSKSETGFRAGHLPR